MLLKDRRKLIIIGVVAVALIIGAVFFIFSRGKSADDYVKEYYGYLENKEYGKMVAVVNNEISSVPLSVAVEKPKRVNSNDEIVKQVRMMGICLGD